MVRKLGIDSASGAPAGYDDSVLSYGLSLGAGWIISKQFRVGAQFLYGEGLGMYSGGQAIVATASGTTPANFNLDSSSVLGGSAFIQWRFTDTMRLNLLYGREDYGYDLQKASLGGCVGPVAATCALDYTQMYAANIMWEPVPAVNIGLQYIYTIASAYNSPNAKQSRLELAFRYNF